MKKIAIIGGGIVGSTAAFYLAKSGHDVHLYDDNIGQATKAAAGIISPWLSQRRNKVWYRLTANGAAFYHTLLDDLKQDGIATQFYNQTGTLVYKNTETLLQKVTQLAYDRRETDSMIGALKHLSVEQQTKLMPELTPPSTALFASGGASIDGQLYTQTLIQAASNYHFTYHQQRVTLDEISTSFDNILLAAGAWLPELLTPLGYTVDVRPQKGQLFSVSLSNKNTGTYPVLMPHSEIDLLPFNDGKWVIGATHENDMGFDLTPDDTLLQKMKHEAQQWLPELEQTPIDSIRVGTRAYTSDFTPFFGSLSHHPHIYVASGLGSSGLTSGPYIAYLLSQLLNDEPLDFDITPYSPDRYATYTLS